MHVLYIIASDISKEKNDWRIKKKNTKWSKFLKRAPSNGSSSSHTYLPIYIYESISWENLVNRTTREREKSFCCIQTTTKRAIDLCVMVSDTKRKCVWMIVIGIYWELFSLLLFVVGLWFVISKRNERFPTNERERKKKERKSMRTFWF